MTRDHNCVSPYQPTYCPILLNLVRGRGSKAHAGLSSYGVGGGPTSSTDAVGTVSIT
jgi:hypothetical protein